ncbi:MAG: hypothetical protein AAF602_20390, partial [Myxococcota bacterium]
GLPDGLDSGRVGDHFCGDEGILVAVDALNSPTEPCDGVDNDCNGLVDDLKSARDGVSDGDPCTLATPVDPPGTVASSVCGFARGPATQGIAGCDPSMGPGPSCFAPEISCRFRADGPPFNARYKLIDASGKDLTDDVTGLWLGMASLP